MFGRSPLTLESRPWYLGALGELEVARVLDQLGPGWLALHAVPVGSAGSAGSDVDHIVIGPGGVFTINSKFHEGGNVWVESRRLMVNGQRTDHLRNAEYEARRAAKLLTHAAPHRVEVTPVIAIVAARRLTIRERRDRVIVVSATSLPQWLQSRPTVLTAGDIAELSRLAAAPQRGAIPPSPNPTSTHSRNSGPRSPLIVAAASGGLLPWRSARSRCWPRSRLGCSPRSGDGAMARTGPASVRCPHKDPGKRRWDIPLAKSESRR
ncbi:nuclease-related domain-containing protein (plasmid) [Coraliomargarita sp. W4R53]